MGDRMRQLLERMELWRIPFEADWILDPYFTFGGLGLTLDQLRHLRALGFRVDELDSTDNWVSPLVESLVHTAQLARVNMEDAARGHVETARTQLFRRQSGPR